MATTVECRAIHLSTDLPDLYVTTAHLPQIEQANGLERFVASSVSTPAWACIRRAELNQFWNSLPDHIQTDFPNGETTWLKEDQRFLDRVLEVQLEGDNFGPVASGFHQPSDPFFRTVEYLLSRRRHGESDDLYEVSLRKEMVYLWALTQLHGVHVGSDQRRHAEWALQEAFSQDIPISHSPGLEGVTLKELASKGVKSACFFPLLGGITGGVNSLLNAKLLLSFQIMGVGAGMTLCAVSTLWLADKLFASIKHIGQD